MGRYSFFINFAVDVLAPVQLSSQRYVYASDFDDGNSSDSVDGQNIINDNDDSGGQEEDGLKNADFEDYKLPDQEQEQENIPSESLIEQQPQTLEITPYAFPTNNWGFNYQIDPGKFWISNYSDFQPKFRTLFMPIYNNFVDHVAGRINDINKNVADNTKYAAFLNARIDSSNKEHGGLQNAINSINAYTSHLNARIDSSNLEHGGFQKAINFLNDRVDSSNSEIYRIDTKHANYTKFLNDRIDSSNSEHGGLQKAINKNKTDIADHFGYFQGRINEVWVPVGKNSKSITDNFDYFQKRVNEVWEPVTKNVADIKFLNARVDSTNSEVYRIDTKHTKSTDFLNDRVDSTNDYSKWVNGKVDNDRVQLNALQTAFNSLDMFTELRKWFGVNDFSNNHGEADGAFTKLMKTQNKNLLASIDSVSGKIKDYTAQFTLLNASTVLNGTKIDSFAKKNDENLTFLLGAIKSLKNYDDSTLKTTINNVGSKIKDYTVQLNAIKTSVDSVSGKIKDYTAQFTLLNTSTVLNGTKIDSFAKKNDENLTFLLAGIAGLKNYDDTSLKTHLTDRFDAYFKVYNGSYDTGLYSTDGVFTKLIKGQFTRLMAELNRIFTLQIGKFDQIKTAVTQLDQNVAEQFGLLYDWLKLEMEWLEVLSENLLTIAKNISTSNDWLKSIYEKPVGGGSVVNPPPEGTNFWDVLKALVDGLAEIAKSIVGLVDDLLDKLVHLIIPENPDFFADDISKLTDSFDLKFSWAIDLSDSFKGIYSQPKSLKSLNISVAGKQYKVVPDFVDLNLIKTILTGYFCFLTLFTSYKRIVGGGDVIQ